MLSNYDPYQTWPTPGSLPGFMQLLHSCHIFFYGIIILNFLLKLQVKNAYSKAKI